MTAGEDRRLIPAFLEMMAAEAGAARNTLLAYRRDLDGASRLLDGRLAAASIEELRRLAEAWMPLKRATVARKAAALRRFFGFLLDEGFRTDDPSSALPRPGAERPLPKILDHIAVDALFREIERRKAEGGSAALRMAASDRTALRIGAARDRAGVAAARRRLARPAVPDPQGQRRARAAGADFRPGPRRGRRMGEAGADGMRSICFPRASRI